MTRVELSEAIKELCERIRGTDMYLIAVVGEIEGVRARVIHDLETDDMAAEVLDKMAMAIKTPDA